MKEGKESQAKLGSTIEKKEGPQTFSEQEVAHALERIVHDSQNLIADLMIKKEGVTRGDMGKLALDIGGMFHTLCNELGISRQAQEIAAGYVDENEGEERD